MTISNGSTVTLLNGTSTTLLGTIINNGTIAQNSTGSDTDLHISGNVTLDGTGVLALSNNFANRIYATGSDSLTNGADHTIEGSGQIGVNNPSYAFTLTNNGTILANQSNTLQVASSGNMTNNGTFQANSGSLLNVIGNLTNYSPTTNTLTGGTYNAYSGTIQLSQADATAITPAVITTNAATILLDGASAKIADGSGNDILQGFFTTNAAGGYFTIQNGASVTTASSDFNNAGTINLLPGTLNVGGNYTQESSGTLGISLGGLTAGTQFGQLNATGTATLAGTFNVSAVSSYQPLPGNMYQVMNFASKTGDFSTYNGLQIGPTLLTATFLPANNPTNLTLNGVQSTQAPTITTNPTSQTVTAGQTATFTAAASGSPTPTVQWQVSTDGGASFSDLSGATNTTLSFTATAAQNGNEYQAVFSNSVGTATTSAATLTVTAAQVAPSITAQPTSQTVTVGQTATFTAAASGNPTPTVQWQVSTDGGSTFSDITGATSTTLTLSNTTTAQNGDEYQAVFTNSVGTATTTAATLTVTTAQVAPSVTTQPTSQTVTAGQTATFTAAASGNPTPTVQWQVSTDGGSTFSDIPGAPAPP